MKKASLFSDVRDLVGAVILTALAVLIASSGAAKAETVTINCPVAQAKREITDGLPGGWWNTPLLSTLSETEVAVIGGQKALICRYGQAGSIQRYAPVGANCTAKTGGFKCETLVLIPPPVLPADTGTITIPHLGGADLDVAGSADDIYVDVVNPGSQAVISPKNGARLAAPTAGALGKAGCQSANVKKKGVTVAMNSSGKFVCYKTSDGRIGELQVLEMPTSGGSKLKVKFTTWP